MTPGGAMAQLFRTIPQAANASREEGEKVRGSKRICTLVELCLLCQANWQCDLCRMQSSNVP